MKENNQELIAQNQDSMVVFGSKNNFEVAQRMAQCLAASSIVPVAYQGEKGLPNCLIALEMANRMNVSPLMVMQNLYIIHGSPAWSSKFLIATVNKSGRFTSLQYEEENEGTVKHRCRAFATEKSTGQILKGDWVSLEMATAEGWSTKNGSKWKTMPGLMLKYRAAAFWQRVYAPEISMGLSTEEELRDIAIDTPYEEVKSEINQNANKEELPIGDLNNGSKTIDITNRQTKEQMPSVFND